MIEKRFSLKHFEDTDWAYDRDRLIYTKEMVDLLNKYDKENKQLKQTNQELYDRLQETMSYKALKMGEVSILKREIKKLKSEVIKVIDQKIRNNNSNPSQDFEIYSKVNNALRDVKESLRDVIEDF